MVLTQIPSQSSRDLWRSSDQKQTSVTYPGSTGCASNSNRTPVPGDKSKPQTCWCLSCAWFTETEFGGFPITTGGTTVMAGSKGHHLLFSWGVLACSCLFSPQYLSKVRFDIYQKAVSLQVGNKNKELDYRNLPSPPSYWPSLQPLFWWYLQFCCCFLLLNLAMENDKVTNFYNFCCGMWTNTIYNILISLSVSTAVEEENKTKTNSQRGETMVRTSLPQSFQACCGFIDTDPSESRISHCFSIYSPGWRQGEVDIWEKMSFSSFLSSFLDC